MQVESGTAHDRWADQSMDNGKDTNPIPQQGDLQVFFIVWSPPYVGAPIRASD